MVEDEAVYASILAHVERSELDEKLQEVARKEWRSVQRRMRHVEASVTALRQLQAAAKYLRPNGDWSEGLKTQLRNVEQLQTRMTKAVDRLNVDRGTKRKRTVDEPDVRTLEEKEDTRWTEKENVAVETDKDGYEERVEDDSDVEFVQVVKHREKKDKVEDNLKDKGLLNEELDEKNDELPCGLVRRKRDATVCVKEEIMPFNDDQIEEEIAFETMSVAESPIELEVLESSEDEEESMVELSDEEEIAVELEVLDSESDDDFSSCLEMAMKLEKAKMDTQLIKFHGAVKQLTSYLVDKKHLAVDELEGYLLTHKRITDDELEEIGQVIRRIMVVGMKLPLHPTIKLALHDLHTIVDRLELALGELPVFLRPFMKAFSDYVMREMADGYSS